MWLAPSKSAITSPKDILFLVKSTGAATLDTVQAFATFGVSDNDKCLEHDSAATVNIKTGSEGGQLLLSAFKLSMFG